MNSECSVYWSPQTSIIQDSAKSAACFNTQMFAWSVFQQRSASHCSGVQP